MPPRNSASHLHRALETAPTEEVFVLIATSAAATLNRLVHGMSAVMLAVTLGEVDLVTHLLAAGADPNLRGRQGRTALHWAVDSGNPAMIAALGTAGANPQIADQHGDTPLHLAVMADDPQMIAHLIAAGADLTAPTADGIALLLLALQWEKEAATAVLIAAGAPLPVEQIRDDDRHRLMTHSTAAPLMQAARHGDLARLQADHAAGGTLDRQGVGGKTLLIAAIESRQAHVIEWLIDHGATIHQAAANGMTPLHLAIQQGDEALVTRLLARGATLAAPHANGWPPLSLAVATGQAAIVAILVAHAHQRGLTLDWAHALGHARHHQQDAILAFLRQTMPPTEPA